MTGDAVGLDGEACCDGHGRACEPPSELCCDACTEAAHQMGDAVRGWHLRDRSVCSAPNLWHIISVIWSEQPKP